ncbi:MAG TPA: dTMP kinase [Polyangiaceae bacterium]|nr:dTMP kinase [Polyangiaceae bacterium]
MFVVFEGIDGSGKTTISNQVAERLTAGGLRVKHLRAGGEFASLVTQAIRELGRDARNFELEPSAEFLLYLARDVQLLQQILRPALAEHDVVIADRSFYTAQVLGQYGRHLPQQWVDAMLEPTTRSFVPELVVLVDVDPKLARARRKTSKLIAKIKKPPSRKGLAGVGLQYRLREGYLQLASKSPERWAVLRNEGTLESAIERITKLVSEGQRGRLHAALQQFRSASTTKLTRVEGITTPKQAFDALLQWADVHGAHEPHVAAYMTSGLWGDGLDARRRVWAQQAPEATLVAATGLDDACSWELREQLLDAHPRFVAQTLNGFEPEHARAKLLRERLIEAAPAEVLQSVSGADDAGSWALRERLFATAPDAVVGSLSGLSSERAWRLREAWLPRRGHSLDEDYETARIALKSISRVGGPQAWQWRTAAYKVAPVAALASIKSLDDAESWQWRRRFLHYAPKIVMATLTRMLQVEAWSMRREVAQDCKEAIDSISKLDEEEAWRLRDACKDTWPSTVVKSLGPLADGARGSELLTRQLKRHSDSLSLLQHAAAIFLGAHRLELPEEPGT